VANPDLAATPEWGFLTAALFWKRKGLNELADIGHFVTITRRINGGVNGLEERERYYEVAKKTLGVAD
jgi:putative chitinase